MRTFGMILILVASINTLFLLDMIFFKEYFLSKKEDKQLVENGLTIQEEYENVQVDEFDERIADMKREIQEKRNNGTFIINETEVITDEFEKELYRD